MTWSKSFSHRILGQVQVHPHGQHRKAAGHSSAGETQWQATNGRSGATPHSCGGTRHASGEGCHRDEERGSGQISVGSLIQMQRGVHAIVAFTAVPRTTSRSSHPARSSQYGWKLIYSGGVDGATIEILEVWIYRPKQSPGMAHVYLVIVKAPCGRRHIRPNCRRCAQEAPSVQPYV